MCHRGADVPQKGLKMGDNYTPTTDEVCEAYIGDAGFDLTDRQADFERWLAAHNAVVGRAALRELADLLEPFSGIGLANGATRADVASWLRVRANCA